VGRKYRNTSNDLNTYYCPQCKRKTLVNRHKHNKRWNHLIWFCTYGRLTEKAQRIYDDGQKAEREFAEGRHSSLADAYADHLWGSTRERYLKLKEEVAAKKACGFTVEFPDRSATKEDIVPILDKMAGDESMFEMWVRENRPDINVRSMETLYESQWAVVVRVKDKTGIGVWVYFEDVRLQHGWGPKYKNMGRSSSQFLQIQTYGLTNNATFSIQALWTAGERLCLWHKDADRSRKAPFIGKLTADLKRKMVDWIKQIEADLDTYINAANAEWERWERERIRMRDECAPLSLNYYSGNDHKGQVSIDKRLTMEEAKVIADAYRQVLMAREAKKMEQVA